MFWICFLICIALWLLLRNLWDIVPGSWQTFDNGRCDQSHTFHRSSQLLGLDWDGYVHLYIPVEWNIKVIKLKLVLVFSSIWYREVYQYIRSHYTDNYTLVLETIVSQARLAMVTGNCFLRQLTKTFKLRRARPRLNNC